MSISVAVRHSITAVRVASILLHDRRAIVDVVSVRIGLLRNSIGTVERAVLAAGVCRVVPGSSAVTVVGCTSIVRIVVTMLRIEAVCAVRAAGVHTLCVAIAGRRCSRSHTDIRVAVGTTRCIVSAGVLRAILIAARVVVVTTVVAASATLVVVGVGVTLRSANGAALISAIDSSFKRSDGVERSFPARAGRVGKVGFGDYITITIFVLDVAERLHGGLLHDGGISGLGLIHSSIWVRLGPALPEAIAALLLGRVIDQDLMLAAATVVGLVTEGARGRPRASGGRRLIHAEVGFRTFAAE